MEGFGSLLMFGMLSFTRLSRYNKHKTVNNDCCMCSIGTMHIHYASLFLLSDFFYSLKHTFS